MKARCIENDPKKLVDHQQSRAVQFESPYSLTIGSNYSIVGMTIAERPLYFLVRDDSGDACYAYAGFFELFDAQIPTCWKFALEEGIRALGRQLWETPGVATWGYPELIDDPDHLQKLYEFDPGALAIFDSYVDAADSVE